LAGITSGDRCFHVSVYDSKSNKIKKAVKLIYSIFLDAREINLVNSLNSYLRSYKDTTTEELDKRLTTALSRPIKRKSSLNYVYRDKTLAGFRFQKFADIQEIVIPFF
jgi:hypothetical protein